MHTRCSNLCDSYIRTGWKTVYVLLLELVARKGLEYLYETGDGEDDIVGDYLCENHHEAIFAAMFPLALDVVSHSVFHVGSKGTLSSDPHLVEVLFTAMSIFRLDLKSI